VCGITCGAHTAWMQWKHLEKFGHCVFSSASRARALADAAASRARFTRRFRGASAAC
jgi:hypothetical protein